MSTQRRDRARRFVAQEGDITIHRPPGAQAIPGISRQTTGADDPAARSSRRDRGLGLGAVREHRGLTQTALAHRLGMEQGSVAKLEGRGDAKLSTIAKYLRALDENADVQLVVRYGDGTTDTVAVPNPDAA